VGFESHLDVFALQKPNGTAAPVGRIASIRREGIPPPPFFLETGL